MVQGETAATSGEQAAAGNEPPFDLAASISRMRGQLRRAVQTMTVPQFALGLGAVTMGAGLTLLPPPIEIGHLMLGIGAMILVLTVAWGPAIQATAARDNSAGLADDAAIAATSAASRPEPALERIADAIAGLDRKIEQLKDTQWELNESESRYRDLLDTQDDVIMRRDAKGRLTFVNRAFGRVFGAVAASPLGKPFRPIVHEGETPDGATFEHGRRRSYTQRIETANGARWFAWDEQLIQAANGHERQFQCVGRDITDQRDAQCELARARDDAQAASRAKSRFLAVMSHEIRTPMNGILGMTSLLTETDLTAEQETYTRAVGQSAKTLLALIDEILDFSKIEAGKLELKVASFTLDECIQGVVELLAQRAHEKGLQIAWTIAPSLPRVVIGDEARVRQILMNLVGNAIKFTDRGGVTVGVGACASMDTEEAAGLSITVDDTGIGIASEAMASIFSEFEQAAPWRTRRHAGTGLGLTISRHLAEAMRGTITAESRLGGGATFTLRLALGRARNGATIGSVLEPLRSAKRVLLVLESRLEAQAMATTLGAQGCAVEVAGPDTAQACIAIALARKQAFDVLMVDEAAHTGRAGAFLRQMRDGAADPAMAAGVRGIVAIRASERDRLPAFRAEGFAGYLVRPVRPASLLAQVSAAAPYRQTSNSEAAGVASRPAIRRAWRPNVLLAEDNEIGALMACAMLGKSGCDVTRVGTGHEAVEAVREREPGARAFDLILMDVHMPDMDGLEASRQLLAMRAKAADGLVAAPRHGLVPPIVALTANAFSEDRAQCLQAGMVDYLAKPFVKAELLSIIEKWCRPLPMGLGHGTIEDGTAEDGSIEYAA